MPIFSGSPDHSNTKLPTEKDLRGGAEVFSKKEKDGVYEFQVEAMGKGLESDVAIGEVVLQSP